MRRIASRAGRARRDFLKLAGGGMAALSLPGAAAHASGSRVRSLKAAPAQAPIGAPQYSPARVWAYNGSVPGPVLRVRQGDTVRVQFQNWLPQPSTLHWHGIRIRNDMDGVAGLTQPAVPPGEIFDYSFTVPDAGTFWYHPHNRTWEQLARGLYGALIVEERNPPEVDRDLVLMFDDWRLDKDGQIHDASFGSLMDWAHAGRLGNWLTVNGRSEPEIAVTKGERLRLRLINACNARVLSLGFADHLPLLVALDGQPIPPRPAEHGVITLAPAQRADVIVDMEQDPGSRSPIKDVSQRKQINAMHFVYDADQVKREAPLASSVRLPGNPLPRRLDLAGALNADLVMEGGAMGRMSYATFEGKRLSMRELAEKRMVWALNGIVGRTSTPLIEAPRGRTVTMKMVNATSWPHAMHLHGHHFRVIERDGKPVPHGPWRDTVLLRRGENLRVAFVADNPGKWLLHCHMVEHQASGMSTWIRVKG